MQCLAWYFGQRYSTLTNGFRKRNFLQTTTAILTNIFSGPFFRVWQWRNPTPAGWCPRLWRRLAALESDLVGRKRFQQLRGGQKKLVFFCPFFWFSQILFWWGTRSSTFFSGQTLSFFFHFFKKKIPSVIWGCWKVLRGIHQAKSSKTNQNYGNGTSFCRGPAVDCGFRCALWIASISPIPCSSWPCSSSTA